MYKKVICADLCYDSLCCLNAEFKISSTKELAVIEDIDVARKVCEDCPYSDLGRRQGRVGAGFLMAL